MFPEKTHTYFPSYLLLSLGIHLIILSIAILAIPQLKQSTHKQITINVNSFQNGSQSTKTSPTSTATSKESAKTTPTSSAASKESAKTSPTSTTTSKESAKTTPTSTTTSKESAKTSPTSTATSKESAKTTPTSTATSKESAKTIPTETPKTPNTKSSSSSETLADELDDLLDKKKENLDTDFLANGAWSGSPRKTVAFPEISDQIPEKYKIRGHGFSVTAKITFSPEGWVSSLHLINSSGDPYIDSIFRNELRKIRIEPTAKQVYDTITKTFTISVK